MLPRCCCLLPAAPPPHASLLLLLLFLCLLQVESLTNLGMGVCRTTLPAAEGEERSWVVMVPGVIPGETVSRQGGRQAAEKEGGRSWTFFLWRMVMVLVGQVVVRVYRNHKNYSEADLLQVLTPAPTRVAPQCQVGGPIELHTASSDGRHGHH